ncbi:hypothetical protein ON010_g5700 [Phytophthora cinnamomi]|nr:hypothetical protein ON010_g5700 [Phytophthora cinnamomi]
MINLTRYCVARGHEAAVAVIRATPKQAATGAPIPPSPLFSLDLPRRTTNLVLAPVGEVINNGGHEDWEKLGLGFGGGADMSPSFDTSGKAASGSIASRQNQQRDKRRNEEARVYFTGGGRTGGGGYGISGGRGGGGYGEGRGYDGGRVVGRGDQSLSHYGPEESKPIAQRKAESPCSYCGQKTNSEAGGRWGFEDSSTTSDIGKRSAAVDKGTLLSAERDRPHNDEGPAENATQAKTVHEAQEEDNHGPAMSAHAAGSPDKEKSCGDGYDGFAAKGKSGKRKPETVNIASTAGMTAVISTEEVCAAPGETVTKTSEARADAVVPTVAKPAIDDGEVDSVVGKRKLRVGLRQPAVLLSGGRTPAARRRQRRTEAELAAVRGILVGELRERQQDRAKVLRVVVQRAIGRLKPQENPVDQRRQEVRTFIEWHSFEQLAGASQARCRQHYWRSPSNIHKRCITRGAPIDVVVGFGGGRSRVLGMWRFIGTTQYQQRITIDALVVEVQGSEFLVGEDWMVERQAKLDFEARELKYRDADGHKVTLRSHVMGSRPCSKPHTKRTKGKGGRIGRNNRDLHTKSQLQTAFVDGADVRHSTRWKVASGGAEYRGQMRKVAGEISFGNLGAYGRLYDDPRDECLQIGDMEPEDRDLFIALLRQYADIIEKKEGCPPLAKANVQHHINTEGDGAWGFPVVLVRKKDGSGRFCIDYRDLNAMTVKDVYPLLRVDETLEALHGSRRFTSLDLHAGYWQLGVAEEDKAKTALTTRKGLFQFRRMPFGLCNAPSTFQRLMDCVLRGLTWICCLVYLDDVVISSRGTIARHVVELAVVLERLVEAGLSLKAAKCSFAATRLECLGHDLTTAGIQPTDRLVKAIVDFPWPTDGAQVRRFVALAGYYRRFVPEFGAKLSPLTRLLRKTSDWEWGATQEEAFAWAKAWLSTKPVLIYPDYSLPFKLTTDASKAGLGAVLSQDQGRGDQPVAYASKVNNPAVAKYTISELEYLAEVWAVRLFRPHLYGRRFTIVTDHVALKWLMTAKEPAGRLHRWALTLQEYDFEIVYRPGKENCHGSSSTGRWEWRRPDHAVPVHGGQGTHAAAGRISVEQYGSASDLSGQGSVSDELASVAARSRSTPTVMELLADARQDVRVAKLQLAELAVLQLQIEAATGMETPHANVPRAAQGMSEIVDTVAVDVDQAADDVVRTISVQRAEAAELGIVQFTDDDIRREQQQSVMVRALKDRGSYRRQRVFTDENGLVTLETEDGEIRVILPAVYWALAFKEAHNSIWAGHLRGPQTYERVRQLYWWPKMHETVQQYTTRYAVAAAVTEHTAKSIAKFLMDKVVLVYGPMREIMMDGAMEFSSKATAELLELLQAKQSTPVPYRPQLLGLVGRFHRAWKDIVSRAAAEESTSVSASHAGRVPRSTIAGLGDGERVGGVRTTERASAPSYCGCTDLLEGQKSRSLVTDGERSPGQVIEQAGYDNYRIKMLESGHELVTHCSFLVPYYYPTNLLDQMAKDIALDLHEEAVAAGDAEADLEGSEQAEAVVDSDGAADEIPVSSTFNPEHLIDILVRVGVTPSREDELA